MKQEIEGDASDTGFRFSLNQLLIGITALTIPIALISKYWVDVNNTVDERTIPFSDVGVLKQSYFIGGLILLGILAIVFVFILIKRRLYFTAGVFGLLCLVCGWPILQQIDSKIISPRQGNETAEIHNDAAAIVATAVDRFYSRTQEWPRSWGDLDDDIVSVIAEIKNGIPQSVNPFGTGDPFLNDESQSIFLRSPDLTAMAVYDIRKLVDIDFNADPKVLAKMNWVEFTGIVPHKPAYNFYRVEFGKLIKRLSESPGLAEQPQDTAK